jgi:hypothetical protein
VNVHFGQDVREDEKVSAELDQVVEIQILTLV